MICALEGKQHLTGSENLKYSLAISIEELGCSYYHDSREWTAFLRVLSALYEVMLSLLSHIPIFL